MADLENNNLETQLRSMILNNVTLTESQTNTGGTTHESNQHPGRGRGHGRGRGRGRGAYRGQAARVGEHNTGPATPAHENPESFAPRGGRGRGWRNGPGLRNDNNPSARPQTTGPSATGGPAQHPPRILVRPTNTSAPSHASSRPSFPPRQQNPNHVPENPALQADHLERLASEEIPKAEISPLELEEKEAFRRELESILLKALTDSYSGNDIANINLVGFGSLSSGFATAGSDIDLALVPFWKDPDRSPNSSIAKELPRLFEKAILDMNMGGRLLTRTRVPILKVCQRPGETLAQALLEERKKWDDLPDAEKYAPPPPLPDKSAPVAENESPNKQPVLNSDDFPSLAAARKDTKKTPNKVPKSEQPVSNPTLTPANPPKEPPKEQQPRINKVFRREKTLGPLDFPKAGVGIQCDINFENPLGIHNTRLLRCYSLCDPRVRLMVLFVKAWAKRRKINSSYAGTLSSYGWVLMVLHYLVNVAQPPVCPNLQTMWRPPPNLDATSLQRVIEQSTIAGYAVRFHDDEGDIALAARSGNLTRNTQSLGALLRGFFQYYASLPHHGYGPRPSAFFWTNEVLSLRTPGGIRTKAEKAWTGAKTTVSNGKEVRNRYLFCIEDPFELDHNVARTVTHFGIVAIRDEFRRAWRVLRAIGRGDMPEGGLFDEIVEPESPKQEDKAAGTDAEPVMGSHPADEDAPTVDKANAIGQGQQTGDIAAVVA
ncbi:unnamed protein product [Periconia digitata]|uniref:polynucleotide adenylyltransferase n=1 Tax=Periconia digitata TaxID=1303443 RepID=A0A9W4UTI5_9PLEO|nr:unnamed protein product [Periconia digitata]